MFLLLIESRLYIRRVGVNEGLLFMFIRVNCMLVLGIVRNIIGMDLGLQYLFNQTVGMV